MKNAVLILSLSVFTTACDAIVGTYGEAREIVEDQIPKVTDYWKGVFAKTDLCAVSEDDLFNFAGGVAVGTQVTAMLAGGLCNYRTVLKWCFGSDCSSRYNWGNHTCWICCSHLRRY